MVTITINIENGNKAAEACREVARMIDNGYTSGLIGCSSDSFDIEGDILSDDKEDEDDVIQTESRKTEVRITAVEDYRYTSSYQGDVVITTRFRLTELFGENKGEGDNGEHEWSLIFDVKYKDGSSEQFGVELYDWKFGKMLEDVIIYWNIGAYDIFKSSIAREVIDMLINGQLENDEYKVIEVKKK